MIKGIGCLGMVLLLPLWMQAQQFKVTSFRLLEQDLSAWVNPVRDLNEEACALVKVVGDRDFVFSSPLGIVKRQEEVGEIWLYLPRGTRKLTIKHPRWGVWRDYAFARVLESRMTYELVLEGPPEKPEESPYPQVTRVRFPRLTKEIPKKDLREPSGECKRLRPWSYSLLASMGLGDGAPDFGVRFVAMRRVGFYVYGTSNFRMQETIGNCDAEGRLPSGELPYYREQAACGRLLVMGGGVLRVWGLGFLYVGAGYGDRQWVWETVEGDRLRASESVRGVAGEGGVMWKWGRMAVSGGVVTIAGKCWEPTLGVGFNF